MEKSVKIRPALLFFCLVALVILLIPTVHRLIHRSSLFEAVKRGDPNEVRRLVNAGADVNQRAKYGGTPLHAVASICHGRKGAEIAEILVAHGAEIDADVGGMTPLWIACAVAKFEIAEVLVAKGADVNAQDSSGFTPLHRAAFWPRKDIIELLVKNGANVDLKAEKFGYTALDLVGMHISNTSDIEERRKYEEIAELLRKHKKSQ